MNARRFVNAAALCFLALALLFRWHAGGGLPAFTATLLIGLTAIDCLNHALGAPSVLGVAGETLSQLWPLQSDSGNNPTLTSGTTVSFKFLDVPDRQPTGPLANYLPGVVATFTGNIVQGAGGTAVPSDIFFGALFSSIDWIQSFYGTVLRGTHVKGAQWCVLEWAASGYRYFGTQRGQVAAAAAGTYPFEVTIFVPANSLRHRQLFKSTMNLALLYRASQLKFNIAPLSVLTSITTGASFTSLKMSASAMLVPRQRITLGTPVEPVLSEPTVNAPTVIIPNFGTDTGFQGVDAGGGVCWLAELTNLLQLGGSMTPNLITSFAFPWRGQPLCFDVLGLWNTAKAMLPQRFVDNLANINSNFGGGNAAMTGAPFIVNNPNTFGALTTNPNQELFNLLYWPLVMYSDQGLDLTNIQTANSDQSYSVNGVSGGPREIMGLYARSWKPDFVKQWRDQVMASGLYGYVYPNSTTYHASRVRPFGERHLTPDEFRYLPYELKPNAVGGDIPAPGI